LRPSFSALEDKSLKKDEIYKGKMYLNFNMKDSLGVEFIAC